MARISLLALLLAAFCSAQTPFLRLQDVKAGMRGIGRTVFTGDRIEEFHVEILGVLDNIGPKQSLILGKLSGGPLEKTGVMQGMSGSPVYIDGKLAGAVAMAFPFAKEPIAGIRPIEEMMRAGALAPVTLRAATGLDERDLTRSLPPAAEVSAAGARLVDIATPVAFSGMTKATLDAFGPRLRALGLEPAQGTGGAGRVPAKLGDPSKLRPGAMISVQLMNGDMSVAADGTVTHIDGDRLYAFGHRFLSIGSTALPFARSEVVTLLPTLSTSFKISTAKELMGVISQDRNAAIVGRLGQRAPTTPVTIEVLRSGARLDGYSMDMVSDRFLSPVLLQMAVFSAIDATERSVGASTFALRGQIDFHDSAAAPIRLDNMFAADSSSAMQVSLSAAVPLAYVLQSGFENLRIRKVDLRIESFDEKKQLQIEEVRAGRRTAKPGETVEISALLTGENGVEYTRTVNYQVPAGAPPGPLMFTVADGLTTNFTELRQTITSTPRSAAQLVSTVNQLRPNTRAYVRVWRPDRAFQVDGGELAAPPPSVSMILAAGQTSAGISQSLNSKVAELEIRAGDVVITGSKTVQVEIKE